MKVSQKIINKADVSSYPRQHPLLRKTTIFPNTATEVSHKDHSKNHQSHARKPIDSKPDDSIRKRQRSAEPFSIPAKDFNPKSNRRHQLQKINISSDEFQEKTNPEIAFQRKVKVSHSLSGSQSGETLVGSSCEQNSTLSQGSFSSLSCCSENRSIRDLKQRIISVDVAVDQPIRNSSENPILQKCSSSQQLSYNLLSISSQKGLCFGEEDCLNDLWHRSFSKGFLRRDQTLYYEGNQNETATQQKGKEFSNFLIENLVEVNAKEIINKFGKQLALKIVSDLYEAVALS